LGTVKTEKNSVVISDRDRDRYEIVPRT